MSPKAAAAAHQRHAERRANKVQTTPSSRNASPAPQEAAALDREAGADEGNHMAEVFDRLAKGSYVEEDLRLVFAEFRSAKTNRLQIKGFRKILETQHVADGGSDSLPPGFISSLFDAWCKEGGLTEARFVHGYVAYLKQRRMWLNQWLSAQQLGTRTQGDEETLEQLYVEVCASDQMSALEFLEFCEAWATHVDEVPPPPGFCHYIFRAFLAGEAKKQKKGADAAVGENEELPALRLNLSKEAFMECATIYVGKWKMWLDDWLKGREDIGNAVREFALADPEALEAMKQAPQSGEDGHDEMSVWIIQVDRSKGERLGMNFGEGGKVEELDDGGLIASWNAQYPAKALKLGDRVLKVNGISEMDLMIAEIGKKTFLDISVGRGYPLRRFVMSRWVLEIDRSHGATTGMDVHAKRDDILVVRSITSGGLLAGWNEAHPWRAVRAGDWFVEANGKTGVYDIADEMKQEKLIDATVCRSEVNHWAVQIDVSTGTNLGMDVHLMHKETCEISHVSRQGLIKAWNAEHPSQALAKGDRILEVNGKSNPSEILTELSKDKVLEIVALRPASPWEVRLEMPVGAAAVRAGQARYVGIQLRRRHNDGIEVKSLDPGSQITVWNSRNPNASVLPNDRILSVNGRTELEPMKDEMRKADFVTIHVLREPAPWVANVDGSDGELGVQVNLLNESAIEVKAVVLGGTVANWNFLHHSESIRPGDRIKSVNGQSGPEAISAELKKRQVLKIEVERDETLHWTVLLDRGTKVDIGALLHVKRRASLEVVGIAKEGLIPDHNKQHAARSIRAGDHIAEVNGVVALDQLKQQLTRMQVLELTMCREELAPASRSETDTDIAHLPLDFGKELEGNEASSLFRHFDRGGKGYWSDADVHYVCRLMWRRQHFPPPPRSFAIEALKRIREEAKKEGASKGAEEHPTRLTSHEVIYGFSRFSKKHHDLLRRWASKRCRNQFKCPNCKGRFRVRIDASGMEVPQVAGVLNRSAAPPSSASTLLPLPAGVAALHEGVVRGVNKGSTSFALPPGSARPALSGRLLMEACAAGLARGAVGILASARELEATASWLAATAPELPRQFLRPDFPQVQLVPDGTWFGKKGGTIFFALADVFHSMVANHKISIDDLDLVVCACGPAEIPLVDELQKGAPLSLLGGLPRVVCLLDASSETHKALVNHLEAIAAARTHLETAAKQLEQMPTGPEVTQAADKVDKMLLMAQRYPQTKPPEHVEARDAGLALAALSGHIDVRLHNQRKVLPQYATEEGRQQKIAQHEQQQRAASAPRRSAAKTPRRASQRQSSAGPSVRPGAGGGAMTPRSQTGPVQVGGPRQPGGGVSPRQQSGGISSRPFGGGGADAAASRRAAANFM